MRSRSMRRAAERKAAKANHIPVPVKATTNFHSAAAPMPIPFELEPVPILPAPAIEVPSAEPQPDAPHPATSQSRLDTNRRNAAIHHGASQRLIVDGERLEEFHALVEHLMDHYQPGSRHEQSLVEDLAHGRWFYWRRQRAFNVIEAELYCAHPDQSLWSDAEFSRLALADRYRIQAERAFQRALRNVEAFAKDRVSNDRLETTHDLAVQHFEMQQEKFESAMMTAAERDLQAALRSAKNALLSPVPSESDDPTQGVE